MEKVESPFQSSFWSGTRLSGASTISDPPFISTMFKIGVDGDQTFCLFPRDSINCPEYKSWKRAYLSGGYLPYESSRLISTIVVPFYGCPKLQ